MFLVTRYYLTLSTSSISTTSRERTIKHYKSCCINVLGNRDMPQLRLFNVNGTVYLYSLISHNAILSNFVPHACGSPRSHPDSRNLFNSGNLALTKEGKISERARSSSIGIVRAVVRFVGHHMLNLVRYERDKLIHAHCHVINSHKLGRCTV